MRMLQKSTLNKSAVRLVGILSFIELREFGMHLPDSALMAVNMKNFKDQLDNQEVSRVTDKF